MIKIILPLLMLLCPVLLMAQDTLNIVYYNILSYPNATNNDPAGNDNARAIAFREIMEEADADIILIEELTSSAGADMLIAELNNNSLGKVFDRAPLFFSYGGTFNIGNMLFYNTNIAAFIQQVEVPRINTGTAPDGSSNIAPRPNSYYELEIFSPTNPADKDTLHCFTGHFKASDTNGDSFLIPDNERRVLSALDMLDYIQANLQADDNIIAGGDFNFYSHLANNTADPTHDEPAYDTLINPVSYPIHFIDKQDPWTRQDASPSNACKYTQSTRLNYNEYGNEGPGGAMDDRFDFALINEAIDLGLRKLKYIENSNIAFGSPKILDVAVTSGTSPVKTQLHAMSDHLPVMMQLEFNFSTACLITNVSAMGSCTGNDYVYDVSFTAGNSSGSYEVVDATSNSVLATGNSSPVSVIIPAISDTTAFDIVLRDALDSLCVSAPLTVTPLDCSALCDITITSINTTCLENDLYDLEICFDFQNQESPDVNILVDGQIFGPYAFPATTGGCIVIPGDTLNMPGDASAMLNVRIENAIGSGLPEGEPFISELHYDNSGGDVEEFVEITAPAGTDLSNYSLEFYSGGTSYMSSPLSGIIPNQSDGCGAIDFLISGIRNNGAAGIALVKLTPTISVIELISYEGTLTATEGPATGLTSTDIGVSELTNSPIGESLQKTDAGWVGPVSETPGAININLTSCGSSGGSSCFDTASYDEPDCISTNCNITITNITTTCLPDSTYDLNICFDYIDTLSSQVNIWVDSLLYGPFSYPASSAGGCILIPGTSLNLPGDATPEISVIIEDVLSNVAMPTNPFISEIHYDNVGTDAGEFVEITAPNGTDLSDYALYFYNGNGNTVYGSETLSGVVLNMNSDCGAMTFQFPFSIQNGDSGNTIPDGIALLYIPTTSILEFISYEGVITAANGPAVGLTSIDIGVIQDSAPIGETLQKTDMGWVGPVAETPGIINNGLTLCSGGGFVCEATTTYNEPDCLISACPAALVENSNPIADGTYLVSDNITAAGTVPASGNVTFDAGVDIDLLPGFEVLTGGEFIGIIGGCIPSANTKKAEGIKKLKN